jgi:hypothetical protein
MLFARRRGGVFLDGLPVCARHWVSILRDVRLPVLLEPLARIGIAITFRQPSSALCLGRCSVVAHTIRNTLGRRVGNPRISMPHGV